jgi:hypothetical protein
MHIDNLPISFTSTDRCRNNHQRIAVHKIPYASLVLGAVARVCDEVEFEGLREWEDDKKDQDELDDRRVSTGGRSHDIRLPDFR